MAGIGASILENIENLKGRENYLEWSFDMKNVLQLEGLWDVIESPPAGPEQFSEEKMLKDTKASALICLSLDKKLKYNVINLETASKIWKKLEDLFSEKGLNTWITLLERITSLKLEDFSSAQAYVDAFADLSLRLEVLKKPLDDELIAALMLKGLPRRFDDWKLSLELSSVKVTSDLVKYKLLDDTDSAQEVVFECSIVPNKKGRPKCYYCGKLGHVQERCWLRMDNRPPPRRGYDPEEELLRGVGYPEGEENLIGGLSEEASAKPCTKPSIKPCTETSTEPSGSNTGGKAESQMCRVCYSKPENGLFVHYNTAHVYGCFSCAKKIWRQNGYCPICRRKILKVNKLFLS